MEQRSETHNHVSSRRSAATKTSSSSFLPSQSTASYNSKGRINNISGKNEANQNEDNRQYRDRNSYEKAASNNNKAHRHHHHQLQHHDQQQHQQEVRHRSSSRSRNPTASDNKNCSSRETTRGKSTHSISGNSGVGNGHSASISKSNSTNSHNTSNHHTTYSEHEPNHVGHKRRSSRSQCGERDRYRDMDNEQHKNSQRSSRSAIYDEYYDDGDVSSVVSSTRYAPSSDRSTDTLSASARVGRSESHEREIASGDDGHYYRRARSDSTRRYNRDAERGGTQRVSSSQQRLDHQDGNETHGRYRNNGDFNKDHERGRRATDDITYGEIKGDHSHSSRRSQNVNTSERGDASSSHEQRYGEYQSDGQNSENIKMSSSRKSSRQRDAAGYYSNAEQTQSSRKRYDEGNQKVLLEAEIYPDPNLRRKENRKDTVSSSRGRKSYSSQEAGNQDTTEYRRRYSSQERRSSQDYSGTPQEHTGELERPQKSISRRVSRNNSFADENENCEVIPNCQREQVYADSYQHKQKTRTRKEGVATRGGIHPSESRQSMKEDYRIRDRNDKNELYSSESRHSNLAHDQFYDVQTLDRRPYNHHRVHENDRNRHYDTTHARRRRSVASYDEQENSHGHQFRRDNSLSNRSSSSRSNHDTGFHSSASSPRREESISRFSSDISPSRYQDDEDNRQAGYDSAKNRRRSRNISYNSNSLDVPQGPLRKDRSLSSSGRGDSSFEDNGQENDIKKNEMKEVKDADGSQTDPSQTTTAHSGTIPSADNAKDLTIRNEDIASLQQQKSTILQEDSPRAECTSSTSTLRGGGGGQNMNSKPSFVGSISSLLSRDQQGASERSFSIGSVSDKWRKLRQGMAPDQASSTSSFASETASLFTSAASKLLSSLPKVPNSFPKAFTTANVTNLRQPQPPVSAMDTLEHNSSQPNLESTIMTDKTDSTNNKSPPHCNSSPQSIKTPKPNDSKSPTINNNHNNNTIDNRKHGFNGVNNSLSPRPSLASTNLSLHSKTTRSHITNKREADIENKEEEEEAEDDLMTPTSEESGQMTPPPMDTDMKRRSKEVEGELTSFLPAEMSRREEKFHDAARMNDAIAIRTILKEKVNINCRNSLDRTALHWAAANGNLAALEALTDAGADLEAKDKYGMRAMLWAAWFGHIPVLQALVNAGANTKITNKQGLGVFHCAAENNHSAVIAFIFEALEPHNVNQTDKSDRTALHVAAEGGHVQTVDVLLQAQADLHKKDKNGKTSVHLAAQLGHVDVLKILLLQGVEVDDRDVNGKTALHLASEGGHKDIVDLLLDYTANPNSETIKEITPLHMSAMEGHDEVCRSLVKYGCNVNAQNFGNTALHLAANANHKGVARVLVEAKCETDLPNSRLQTPLHIAVESGHIEVVQTLLAGGASLEAREKSGKSALQLAARGNYVSVVDMLIKAERYYAIARDYHDNDVGYVDPDTYLRNASHPNATQMKDVLWKLAYKQLKPTDWKKLAHFWHFTPEHIKAIEQEYTGTMSYKDHGYRLLLIWLHGVRKDENVLKLLFEALMGIEKRHLAENIRRKANMAADKDKPCSPSVCSVS